MFRGQKMTKIAQMRDTQTSHFINKNRSGNRPPTGAPLARNINDGDILDAGADGIPRLLEGNPTQDHRISGHRASIVMGKMIVADGHRIGLDTRGHVEIRTGNHFYVTAGLDQKTGVSKPVDEGRAKGWRPGTITSSLHQMSPMMKQLDQRRIAHRFGDAAQPK